MSYFQATMHKPAYRPVAGLGRTHELLGGHSMLPHSTRSCKLQQKLYPKLVLVSAYHKRLGHVYASSGKENPDVNDISNAVAFPWIPFSMESLNKAMAQAKKPRSLKDLLREQMAKIQGQGSGGNGGNKNRYGRSGGGSDGPEDESFKDSLNEMVQILIATVAFIFVYIHIIRGEELYRLARDYTRYLVTGKRTSRLKRAMLNWCEFSERFTNRDSAQEEGYYGRSGSSESTWWQQPQQLARRLEELCRGYLRPHAQES